MRRLTWERHAGVWRLVDKDGYTRAYVDFQGTNYYAVYWCRPYFWIEEYDPNLKRLKTTVTRLVKEALAT